MEKKIYVSPRCKVRRIEPEQSFLAASEGYDTNSAKSAPGGIPHRAPMIDSEPNTDQDDPQLSVVSFNVWE